MDYSLRIATEKYPEVEFILLDLAEYDLVFSDARHYTDYEGDTKFVTKTIMESDAVIIGTPTFQASIPATLKNVFDLLPVNAFHDNVVGTVVTAGTPRHYLMVELEQQLKPILAYMKAQIVQTYVFIEEEDFHCKEIINDDVIIRIERLVEDTVLTETYKSIREAKEAAYGF